MLTRSPQRGFTIVELLAVVAVIAILAALLGLNFKSFREMGYRAACLSNLRQIGVAVQTFANEHDMQLPGRAMSTSDAKWPVVLAAYLQNPRVYSAPGRANSAMTTGHDPLSNLRNYTSFILNGFNDLGALDDPSLTVRLVALERPSSVILVGMPHPGSGHFYMDMLEGAGNHNDVLDLTAYGSGSPYLFADGSARVLTKANYDHKLWLVNRDFPVPPAP